MNDKDLESVKEYVHSHYKKPKQGFRKTRFVHGYFRTIELKFPHEMCKQCNHCPVCRFVHDPPEPICPFYEAEHVECVCDICTKKLQVKWVVNKMLTDLKILYF
jgi:hypothetical protein